LLALPLPGGFKIARPLLLSCAIIRDDFLLLPIEVHFIRMDSHGRTPDAGAALELRSI
jgi:hypothetical protein